MASCWISKISLLFCSRRGCYHIFSVVLRTYHLFDLFNRSIISYTMAHGAGGFFLGLLVGAITAIFMILSARIGMEAFLSLVAIRDRFA
jgi:ABC-type nitrate/sulfonate/bicarbonate transport system permease component